MESASSRLDAPADYSAWAPRPEWRPAFAIHRELFRLPRREIWTFVAGVPRAEFDSLENAANNALAVAKLAIDANFAGM
jgi:hypothetical protein